MSHKHDEFTTIHDLDAVTGGFQVLGLNRNNAPVGAPAGVAKQLGLTAVHPAGTNPQVLGLNGNGARVAAPFDVATKLNLHGIQLVR